MVVGDDSLLGASTRLESANTTLTNPGPCVGIGGKRGRSERGESACAPPGTFYYTSFISSNLFC